MTVERRTSYLRDVMLPMTRARSQKRLPALKSRAGVLIHDVLGQEVADPVALRSVDALRYASTTRSVAAFTSRSDAAFAPDVALSARHATADDRTLGRE